MARFIEGAVGILPPSALGCAYFYHLTEGMRRLNGRVFFLERRASASGRALRAHGEIRIASGHRLEGVSSGAFLKPDLLAGFERGQLPEVVLVCANPDQLLGILDEWVRVIERISEAGELGAVEASLPLLVLTANGIYFQRTRQLLIERLEEATLLGRLPDLWPALMPRVVGRLLRGVSLQSGVREGEGAETVYRPGPRGLTRIAGGEGARRCCEVLLGHGGWVELAAHGLATRLEIDKAMFNLPANLLGQIYAIDETGGFCRLTVAEIVVPERLPEIRELAYQVFLVGKAIKVYAADEDFETVYAAPQAVWKTHGTHIPSSLQWVALGLRRGTLKPEIPPTEAWLLDPLMRCARSAGLEGTADYFERLKGRLEKKLRLAVARACAS